MSIGTPVKRDKRRLPRSSREKKSSEKLTRMAIRALRGLCADNVLLSILICCIACVGCLGFLIVYFGHGYWAGGDSLSANTPADEEARRRGAVLRGRDHTSLAGRVIPKLTAFYEDSDPELTLQGKRPSNSSTQVWKEKLFEQIKKVDAEEKAARGRHQWRSDSLEPGSVEEKVLTLFGLEDVMPARLKFGHGRKGHKSGRHTHSFTNLGVT